MIFLYMILICLIVRNGCLNKYIELHYKLIFIVYHPLICLLLLLLNMNFYYNQTYKKKKTYYHGNEVTCHFF